MMLKTLLLLAIVAVTNAQLFESQAETCSNAVFRLASEIDKGFVTGKWKNPFPHVGGSSDATNEEGAFPNIEWDASVPLEKWSLASGFASKKAPFPMGFRRTVMRPLRGGVLCLKIPSSLRSHKLELMVESDHKQTLCVSDTRVSKYNHSGSKVLSQCDPKGQMIACFSGLQNGKQTDTALGGDGTDANAPNQAVDAAGLDKDTAFSLVIGCSGSGCSDNAYTIFYRIRASAVTWATDFGTGGKTGTVDNAGAALESLDVWCMVMENRDPVLGVSDKANPTGADWEASFKQRSQEKRELVDAAGNSAAFTEVTMPDGSKITLSYPKTYDEKQKIENMFPQYFPSDLWAPIWTAADEALRLANEEACAKSALGCERRAVNDNEKFNPYASMGAASNVVPTILAIAAPLVALLF